MLTEVERGWGGMAVDTAFLRQVSLFAALTDVELMALAPAFSERRYAAGEVVFTEEATGQCMYVVREGRVKVSRWLPSGRELILAHHDAPEHFGEMALLDGHTAPATVTAATRSVILSLSRPRFEELLHKPHFTRTLLDELCARCRAAWQQIELVSHRDAEARVRMALYRLCQSHGRDTDQGRRIEMRLTHRELANMVGITRETATRALMRLEGMKLVQVEDRFFVVPEPDRLIEGPVFE
jgi:CRP/FNR family cyclic AMP-dependent transcriptional regulator